MTLGGRAAEELVFNEVTTGAANDIEKITHTAKQMVMRYGMSEKLGPRVLGRNSDMPFLGRDMGHEPDYSDELAREIDDEVRRIIEDGHELALKVLREHMDELHRISQILIERETIDKDQFERLLAGEDEDDVFAEQDAQGRRRRSRRRARAAPAAEAAPVPAAGRDDAAARARRRLTATSTLGARGCAAVIARPPIEERFPRPSVMGVRQRHARLVLGRRRAPAPGVAVGRGAADARRGRGDRRRRRRVDAARRRRRSRSTRSCGASCRCWRRSPGEPVSIDTSKAEVARRALELGRRARERRDRAARRSGARRRRRRRGRVPLPDAHARRAADDAGRPRLRRRRLRGEGVPRGAARVRRRRRASARSASASIPGIGFGKTVEHNFELVRRLDELVAIGRPVLVGLLAQELARPDPRRPGGDDRARRRRRSARRSRPTSAARRSSACTTCASTSRRCASREAVAGMKIELRGLELFGHHGVTEEERDARPAVRLRRRARGGRARRRRPDRGRGRLPRGRRGRPRGRRAAASRCSRRSPTAIADALVERFAAERVRVRVRKPEVRPAGIELEFAAVTAERRR